MARRLDDGPPLRTDKLTLPVGLFLLTCYGDHSEVRLGKLTVPSAIVHDFSYVVKADGFRLLALDAASAIRAGQLDSPHRDPFDRLIGAHALTLGAAVVTNDAAFADLGVDVLW